MIKCDRNSFSEYAATVLHCTTPQLDATCQGGGHHRLNLLCSSFLLREYGYGGGEMGGGARVASARAMWIVTIYSSIRERKKSRRQERRPRDDEMEMNGDAESRTRPCVKPRVHSPRTGHTGETWEMPGDGKLPCFTAVGITCLMGYAGTSCVIMVFAAGRVDRCLGGDARIGVAAQVTWI